MDSDAFKELLRAIRRRPWRKPFLKVRAFDGVAWEIESYGDDGSVVNTSGKMDYIYGHRVLEAIVRLLPTDGNLYTSSAFISL